MSTRRWRMFLLNLAFWTCSLSARWSIDAAFPPDPEARRYVTIQLSEPDSTFRLYLTAARDCIADKAWGDCTLALQSILDVRRDQYVKQWEKDLQNDKPYARWVSMKVEAQRLLGSLPKAGRDAYEKRSGDKALSLLNRGLADGNMRDIMATAQTYGHTSAGQRATAILASLFRPNQPYLNSFYALQLSPVETAVEFTGKILTISGQAPKHPFANGKIVLEISKDTKLLRKIGNERKAAVQADLKSGLEVEGLITDGTLAPQGSIPVLQELLIMPSKK